MSQLEVETAISSRHNSHLELYTKSGSGRKNRGKGERKPLHGVNEDFAEADKLFSIEPKQLVGWGVDAKETVLAVRLAVLYWGSGPAEGYMAMEGVEMNSSSQGGQDRLFK